MEYKYTETNRFEKPLKYAYEPFLGNDFLNAYFEDRLSKISHYKLNNNKFYNFKIDSFFCNQAKKKFELSFNKAFSQSKSSWRSLVSWDELNIFDKDLSCPKTLNISSINFFDLKNDIDTEKLISSLIFNQINDQNHNLVKEFLDLIVKKFEITKKLYKTYPAGFRKGKGKSNNVRLYWLFSLSLLLFFENTKKIKYLSTLLKISDILCSLSNGLLEKSIIPKGLSLTLSVEFLNLRLLSYKAKDISIE